MAEKDNFDKTLTREELATETYLEWSNETLGRCVKHMAKKLGKKDVKGWESIKTMAAAYTLVGVAISTNAGTFKQTLYSYTIAEKQCGDWEIIVRQKKRRKI